jgi:maspardin
MTLIDSLDKTARPPELREELWAQYPQAKQAHIRVGGDFPFLSSAEEVNLFIEVQSPRLQIMKS